MKSLANLDVDMTNVHAAGTIKMMEAGLRGLTREDGTRPLLIAVTQLTSTSQETMEQDLLIKENIEDVVIHYAENAKKTHKDPFDRMLIAQAKSEGMFFMTHDSLIPNYNEDFIISV